jgi:phage FluMu protein Com
MIADKPTRVRQVSFVAGPGVLFDVRCPECQKKLARWSAQRGTLETVCPRCGAQIVFTINVNGPESLY